MTSRLITIPMSHYCEKGRWALDAADLAYAEDGWVPGLHLAAILPRRAQTTPVLVTGGATLRGSDVILDHGIAHGAGALMPADTREREDVARWLRIADTRLAPASRRWYYSWALADGSLLAAMARVGVPGWQRAAVAGALPAIAALVRRRFSVDARTRRESAERAAEVFAEADRARPAGSPYLVGDRFTAADLAFAALAAPMVLPDAYGPPGALTIRDVPSAMRAEVERLREEPCARAVLTVYARHRRPTRRHHADGDPTSDQQRLRSAVEPDVMQ